MIKKLKLIYPSIDISILNLIADNCEQDALDYCNLTQIPPEMESVIFRMAQETINKIGAEGFQSESSGGNSVSYSTDYSDAVYKRLNKHKKMRLVKCSTQG